MSANRKRTYSLIQSTVINTTHATSPCPRTTRLHHFLPLQHTFEPDRAGTQTYDLRGRCNSTYELVVYIGVARNKIQSTTAAPSSLHICARYLWLLEWILSVRHWTLLGARYIRYLWDCDHPISMVLLIDREHSSEIERVRWEWHSKIPHERVKLWSVQSMALRYNTVTPLQPGNAKALKGINQSIKIHGSGLTPSTKGMLP